LFERLLPQVEYVGEIGLDGSRDHRPTLDRQCVILTDILAMCARAGGRKLSIHSRGATGRILDILEVEPNAGPIILHWYLGTPRQVERAADLGAWFSVGPSMLRSERGRSTVAQMPRGKVLPETDGPFGRVDDRPSFPWDSWLVVPVLADLWQMTQAEAQDQLISNFRTFLG
jgi:TatD DNase family protein